MSLTAYLSEDLARMAQQERRSDAAHSRLVRLAAGARDEIHPTLSIRQRISLAIRPAPATCQPC